MTESVTVTWAWQPAGRIEVLGGKLVFPHVPAVAGVYRFTFFDAAGLESGLYVGEADLLPRRFQQYRAPGLSQKTNLRLNPIMVAAIEDGGHVVVEIVTEAQAMGSSGEGMGLDMTWKASRVMVERAAEVDARTKSRIVLNR